MAIKTFTTGEVLTASDTNTYLNDSGLVLITSGITVSSAGGTAATVANGTVTIGTSNTSVTVSGAFSATYENYVIVASGFAASSLGAAAYIKLNNSTGSTYYGNMIYNVPTSSAIGGVSAANGAANGFFTHTASTTGTNSFSGTLNAPFLAVTSNYYGNFSGRSYNGQFSSHDSNAASSTGFILAPSAGNFTGGTIRVYGYRQP